MNGILAYIKTLSKLGELRLVKYVLISGLISLAIGAGVTSLSIALSDDIGLWLSSLYPWDRGSGMIKQISQWSSGIAVFLLGLFLLKYLLLIILSPIMSLMSERIEAKLSHSYTTKPFTAAGALSDFIRSIRINLRNLFRELSITILLLIFSFVPGFALVTTPLIFIVQAYYAGFGLLDYWMERHYRLRDSVSYVRAQRINVAGIGTIYLLILLIPILGVLLAPVWGTAAATLYAVDKKV